MKLFNLTLKYSGFPIKEARNKLKEIKAIPNSEYEEFVIREREAIVRYHTENNPYYNKLINNRRNLSWEEIPVLTKADLQHPLKERLSNGYTSKNSYVNKTSGSSGHPFIFAKDKWCHALTWAEIMDRFGWFGIDFNHSLQARFYGIPLGGFGYRKERLKDLLSSRYRFSIFDLSEEKMAQFLQHFRQKKFCYINGYTSAIVLFAKYLKKQNILLIEICPTLKYCIVTSEMLFETDKQLMEQVLGVPVINEYGASELDLIAFTNPEGEFVVNSETLFVEVLDENNRAVPNGTSGRIVITSLFNKAHPLIRYDIGDTGSFTEMSTFKKPAFKTLIGRTNDVAKLKNGKNVPGLTFYYVTKSVIEDDGNVKEFVIEQLAIDAFKITYVSEEKLSITEANKIKKALYKYLEDDLELTFNRVEVLERGNRGKLKQFVSKLK